MCSCLGVQFPPWPLEVKPCRGDSEPAHSPPSAISLSLSYTDIVVTSTNRADARQAGVFMYIDPTSGSLALQVLAAGALSALAMFSRIREAIKSFFRNLVSHGRRWSGHR